MRILIADDEVLSRRLLEKTLERAGYQVICVDNGRAAADQLSRPDAPRLALLDWIMPELDGPGVCREVRKRREQEYVYMVLLSSRESKGDIVAGLESGADDYLTKPFDAEELKARLRTGQRILTLEDRLVEAREQMRFKATHDALTSLWNRGVMMDLLSRELARSNRERSCTAILLCDIDHFKTVNDTHGHGVGDAVLREVAHRLLSSVRSYDFVGRHGGEEFLVVLNNCEPPFAQARAEEIRKNVGLHPIQTARGAVQVTLSVGLLFSRDLGAASDRRPAARGGCGALRRQSCRPKLHQDRKAGRRGERSGWPREGDGEDAVNGSRRKAWTGVTGLCSSMPAGTSYCAWRRWNQARVSPARSQSVYRSPQYLRTFAGS